MKDHRLELMHNTKQELVNWNLADVLLYFGRDKTLINKAVGDALLGIARDQDQQFESRPLFIITFSLGSFIAEEVLLEFQRAGRDDDRLRTAGAIQNQVCKVYMLSNQVPLLRLAKPDSVEAAAMEGLRPLSTSANEHLCVAEPRVVAFSDPNDLLSYSFFDELKKDQPSQYVDVVLSIARTGYRVPAKRLPYVSNPLNAHTGYGQDEKALDLIVKGGTFERQSE